MSASDISKQLHMSVPAIIDRIRKLENEKVITKYSLQVNYSKFGRNIVAYISVGFESSKLDPDIREYLEENDEIVECSFVTGDYDYLLKVITKDPESLTNLIHTLKSYKKVSKTRTVVVLENIKDGTNPIF